MGVFSITAPVQLVTSRTRSTVVLCLSLLVLCADCAVASPPLREPHWVSFYSAPAVPSTLARRALGDAVDAARPRDALRGLLVIPEGEGPFPAVVLMHGCRGVLSGQRGWAQWFARQGFVALLVDSFFTRHASGVCSLGPDEGARQEVSGRVFDAFGALEFLHRDPRVDPDRAAIMGWNTWIPMSAVSRGGPRALARGGFSAAVAVSPDCPLNADSPTVPVLMVVAARDELHAARNCEWLAARSGGAIELKILAGAGHGFDDVEASAARVTKVVFHLASASYRQIPVRYHRAAHEQATREVLAFLSPRLGATAGGDIPRPATTLPVGAAWAVDPSRPGPDRPPLGRSLFDRVFADDDGQVRVPFPFSSVLDRLESELGAEQDGSRGSRQGMAISLIPLGRSLQRNAAAPEFFRFPRVVVAVDGEPTVGPARRWLKDRLFLGYQEKARVIEVISYNATLGRFEFQIVDDYAEGAAPRVRYANRSVCVSCHQNGAAIFSRAAWDETNSNLPVARRLREAGGNYHDLVGNVRTEAAARVDNATDRANLLSVWQRVWREGCGGRDAAARACRGAAFVAMLQDRLSGSSGHDQAAVRYKQGFLAPVAARWDTLWPGGLAVPDPDLVNREPILDPTPTEISARDDPLTARPPAAIWRGTTDAWRLVPGLAESLSKVDLAALDEHLRIRGRGVETARTIPMSCRVSRRGVSSGYHRLVLGCRGQEKGGRLAPEFEVALDLRGRVVLGGSARYLELGDGVLLERVRLSQLESSSSKVSLALRQGQSGWSVRTVRGHAVERIELDWRRVEEAVRSNSVTDGVVTMHVLADFQPAVDAVAAMVADPKLKALDAGTFRPLPLMRAVMVNLGADHPPWCCERQVLSPVEAAASADINSIAAVPTGLRDVTSSAQGGKTADIDVIAAFNRRCGACHRANAKMPPGFLNGSGVEVRQALQHCAPRIAQRLSMWLKEPESRQRSPMPPPMLLGEQGLAESDWISSDDYRMLLQWSRDQVSAQGSAEGSHVLQGCLPAPGAFADTAGEPARVGDSAAGRGGAKAGAQR